MEVLTQDRAKPALPFAGTYRLLDFALSNLRHSGVDDVWVLVQFETQSILDVLAGGRPWDLDRSHGGLRIVPPQQESDDEGGWHAGNAHALYANRALIAQAAPEVLLVMSADHVYKLDYGPVIDQHRRTGAEATVVSAEVGIAQARHHAVLDVRSDGLVTAVTVKPDDPTHGVVAPDLRLDRGWCSNLERRRGDPQRCRPALIERAVSDYRSGWKTWPPRRGSSGTDPAADELRRATRVNGVLNTSDGYNSRVSEHAGPCRAGHVVDSLLSRRAASPAGWSAVCSAGHPGRGRRQRHRFDSVARRHRAGGGHRAARDRRRRHSDRGREADDFVRGDSHQIAPGCACRARSPVDFRLLARSIPA